MWTLCLQSFKILKKRQRETQSWSTSAVLRVLVNMRRAVRATMDQSDVAVACNKAQLNSALIVIM